MSLFANDRHWLEDQPPLNGDWENGTSCLMEYIVEWIHTFTGEYYSREVEPEATTEDPETVNQFQTGLWRCWKHHWQKAIERNETQQADGIQEARYLLGEDRRPGQARNGHNLLRDVVIAAGALQGDAVSLSYLYELKDKGSPYHHTIQEWADIRSDLTRNPDWWDDLVALQLGYRVRREEIHYEPEDAPLNRFSGGTYLVDWILNYGEFRYRREVDRRNRKNREVNSDLLDINPDTTITPETDLMNAELREVMATLLREVWENLDLDHETKLCIQNRKEGWTLTEIGRVVGIHAGNVSRRIDSALKKFSSEIERYLEEHPQIAESLEDFADRNEFRGLLHELFGADDPTEPPEGSSSEDDGDFPNDETDNHKGEEQ